ncbi:nucleotidyltransferase family protein, partial [Verrucomicrobiota bacterium]
MLLSLRHLVEDGSEQALDKEEVRNCLLPGFLAFADRQRISGSLFPIIRHLPSLGRDQESVRDEFHSRYLSQWALNERLLTLYRELWRHFQDNGLGEHVVFPGGTFFGRRFYGNNSQGFVPAIDICLLTPEMKDQLIKLLSGRGYSPLPGIFPQIPGCGFGHAVGFRRNRFFVNIHFNTCSSFSPLESAQLNARLECHVFDGICYPVLSPEYELIWKILTVFRDIESGGIHLDVLLDIHALIQTVEPTFDWPAFFRKRVDDGMLVLTMNVLDMVLTLFECQRRCAKLEHSMSCHQESCR